MTLVLGIDGGGSSVTAVAAQGERVVFRGSGGPANLVTTPWEVVARHLDEALDGCPTPARVGACFAGFSEPGQHPAVAAYLERRFPDAETHIAPDHVAALLASQGRFDLCCIAGTGSVCASLCGGSLQVSGGRGFLIGDHGSAHRYGQALLAFVLELPDEQVPPQAASGVVEVFGTVDPRVIVRVVHDADAPASLLARLAPTLTAAADAGEPWAGALVDDEAARLARTVAGHVERYLEEADQVRVALAGGTWASAAVRRGFASHLGALLPKRAVAAERLDTEAVAGAVRLARMSAEEVARLGY